MPSLANHRFLGAMIEKGMLVVAPPPPVAKDSVSMRASSSVPVHRVNTTGHVHAARLVAINFPAATQDSDSIGVQHVRRYTCNLLLCPLVDSNHAHTKHAHTARMEATRGGCFVDNSSQRSLCLHQELRITPVLAKVGATLRRQTSKIPASKDHCMQVLGKVRGAKLMFK